jgi:hypothetical protein
MWLGVYAAGVVLLLDAIVSPAALKLALVALALSALIGAIAVAVFIVRDRRYERLHWH